MTSAPNNFTMTANASVAGFHSMSRASSSYQNTLQRTAENNIIYESSGKMKQVSQNSTQQVTLKAKADYATTNSIPGFTDFATLN